MHVEEPRYKSIYKPHQQEHFTSQKPGLLGNFAQGKGVQPGTKAVAYQHSPEQLRQRMLPSRYPRAQEDKARLITKVIASNTSIRYPC